jgi:hypothetical protein
LSRRIIYWCVTVALPFAAFLAMQRTAVAYTTDFGTRYQPGGLGTPVEITYSYKNMFANQNPPGIGLLMPNGERLPDDLIRNSIEEALGLWASVAPLYFIEVPDDGLGYDSVQRGELRFQHDYIDGPDLPPPAAPNVKARAHFPDFGGEVWYDNGDPWQEVGTIPTPDILGATIHELGHSLGLNHSNEPGANMQSIFPRFSGLGSGQLSDDDIAGVQFLYGAGVGSVTPLDRSTVPEPSWMLVLTVAVFQCLSVARQRRPVPR